MSRVLRSAVDEAAQTGHQGRPVPPNHSVAFSGEGTWQRSQPSREKVLVVELSNGQMVEDVRLALNGKRARRILRTRGRKRAIGCEELLQQDRRATRLRRQITLTWSH